MTLSLPVEAEANELLTRSPLALLIGMLLDQQVPLEKAFSSPLELVRRLGHEPTAAELAEFDPEALTVLFSERPALHRFPKAMAARTQDLARLIMDRYDGDPAAVWTGAISGSDLVSRLAGLPGWRPGSISPRTTLALLRQKRFCGGSIRFRSVSELVASFAYGKLVHDGFTLAIVGRPNVGKSSLFNRLLEQDRAIVTEIPELPAIWCPKPLRSKAFP